MNPIKNLTSPRLNGIKSGYWSTAKKEELVQALAYYEHEQRLLQNIGSIAPMAEKCAAHNLKVKLSEVTANMAIQAYEKCIETLKKHEKRKGERK